MCEILGVTELERCISLDCTPYNGDFRKSKELRISDGLNNVLTVTDFCFESTRKCFSSGEQPPWIILKKDVPQNFLQRGNKIEFVY